MKHPWRALSSSWKLIMRLFDNFEASLGVLTLLFWLIFNCSENNPIISPCNIIDTFQIIMRLWVTFLVVYKHASKVIRKLSHKYLIDIFYNISSSLVTLWQLWNVLEGFKLFNFYWNLPSMVSQIILDFFPDNFQIIMRYLIQDLPENVETFVANYFQ